MELTITFISFKIQVPEVTPAVEREVIKRLKQNLDRRELRRTNRGRGPIKIIQIEPSENY